MVSRIKCDQLALAKIKCIQMVFVVKIMCNQIVLCLCLTWFLAEPCMTTAGLTASGGTGRTVTTIQSGRANLEKIHNY